MKNFAFLDSHLIVRTATKTMEGLPSSSQSSQPLPEVESDDDSAAGTAGSPTGPTPLLAELSSSKEAAAPSQSVARTSAGRTTWPYHRPTRKRPDYEDYLEKIADKMSASSQLQDKVII
jgi:hypothetical protein